jgi:hypothetical protein
MYAAFLPREIGGFFVSAARTWMFVSKVPSEAGKYRKGVNQMSVEQLGMVAGIILSLALAYVPKLNDWYNAKDKTAKVQIMGGLLVVAALGVFGLSCANVFVFVACSMVGAKELLGILVSALIANQATFMFAVRPFQRYPVYAYDGRLP